MAEKEMVLQNEKWKLFRRQDGDYELLSVEDNGSLVVSKMALLSLNAIIAEASRL